MDRSYPFFASQKSIKLGFNANSLAQTFALLYEGAGLEGARMAGINVTVNGAIDAEGTARTIVKTLNDSYFRGTGGAGALAGLNL